MRVAAVAGEKLYIKNLPATTQIGAHLIVFRITNIVKDEKTGEILDRETQTVGELEVVSKTETAFVCKVVSGTGFKADDLVKIK